MARRDATPHALGFEAAYPETARGLDAIGLTPRGTLSAARYDRLVPAAWRTAVLAPSARTIVVVGAGGRALGDTFRRSPEAAGAADPLDAFVARALGDAMRAAPETALRVAFAFETHGGAYADFVALGRAAGLGAPSRLGLLVHSEYGPWLSLRALVFLERALAPTPERPGFAPCDSCSAPCVSACHGGAVAPSRFDVRACGATRAREAACARRCDARRACPLGRAHAYDPVDEARHMSASLAEALARAGGA